MSKLPPINTDLDPVYVPYGRKSHKGEKKDQRHTEREQREGCLAFVTERIKRAGRGELAPDPWEFDDKTGTTDKRDAYQRRLADVRALRAQGRQVYFVVRLLDRLGRDAEELHRCKKELDRLGVTLLAVDFAGEIADEVFPYVVATAQVGSLKIAANVKRINAQVRRDGWWRPGRVPWGYRAVPTTEAQQAQGAPKATLAIDEAQAPAVREVFARVASGASVHGVARWVAGLSEAQRGIRQTKDGARARTLAQQEIRALLRSRTYIGQQPDGAEGRWPAIVALETWEAAQAQLEGAKGGPAKQATGTYLLTGLLWCPVCHGRGADVRMHGWHRSGDGSSARYACTAYQKGAGAPEKCYYSVLAAAAEADVRRQVAPLVDVLARDHRAALLGEVAALLREPMQGPGAGLGARLAAVQAKIDTAKRRRRVLMERLADETISDDEFREEVAPIRAALADAERELAGLAPEHATGDGMRRGSAGRRRGTVADVARELDRVQALWLADTSAAQRDVLVEWIARVAPVRGGAGQVTCHVEWTDEGQILFAAAAAAGLVAREQPAGDGAEGTAAG
jgi:DNA invertase Pin-like site-specific DNA recombinase